MLLAVDAGNTDTVIGLYDLSVTEPQAADDGLIDHWRIATHAERTADEHAVMFQGFLAAKRRNGLDDIEGIVISSGVPRVMANLRNMADRYLGRVGRRARARHPHRRAHPHRPPPGGRRRPHRQRRGRLRPLRRPDDHGRLRHGDDL